MRIGLAVHDGRISPVLDVARRLLIVDVDPGREPARQEVALSGESLAARVACLRSFGLDVLICGAASCSLEAALRSAGLTVLARTCGPANEVLDAYLTHGGLDGAYLMPGCCGTGRRRGRGHAGTPGTGRGRGRGRHRFGAAPPEPGNA